MRTWIILGVVAAAAYWWLRPMTASQAIERTRAQLTASGMTIPATASWQAQAQANGWKVTLSAGGNVVIVLVTPDGGVQMIRAD